MKALLLCALPEKQRPRDALLRYYSARALAVDLCLNLVPYRPLAR